MSQELTNITEEEKKLLDQHSKEYSGGGYVSEVPLLKVSLEGENKGKYVLEKSEKIEVEGKPTEYEKVQTLVKDNNIIVLRKRYSYSYYDNDKKSLEIWTNEIDTFEESQPVVIFDKSKDLKNPEVLNYKEFKEQKLQRSEWVKIERGETKSILSFTTILYVVVDGVFARFMVKMSSLIGQQADGSYNFKSPMPGSLKAVENEMGAVAPYTKYINITPLYVEGSVPYYKTQFILGDYTEIRTQISNRVALDKALAAIDNFRNRGAIDSEAVASDNEAPMPTEELPTIQIEEPAGIEDNNGDEININDVFGS